MIVAIATDHGGYSLKEAVTEAIRAAGHEPLDLGADAYYSSDDYPDYAALAGQALQQRRAERAVLICGSGVGICIAANKIEGVYACVCHDTYMAHQGVEHDSMNALCLGGRVIGDSLAKEIVGSFLSAEFSHEERHLRRTNKICSLEVTGQIEE